MVVLLADLVARAGGGQNFGGGGGGGSRGGGSIGGGGGGGGGFFFFPFLGGGGAGGGAVGTVILVVLVVMVVIAVRGWMRRGGMSSLRSTTGVGARYGGPPVPGSGGPYDDTHPVGVPERFSRGETLPGTDAAAGGGAMAADTAAAGIEAIRAHDPAFDQSAFLALVERSFFVVQQAWSECKPEMSRRVMADGIWQQQRVQIEEYERQGRRNMLDSLAVGNVRVIAAHTDQSYDTITTRIRAASADYDVDTASGKVVRGDRSVREWSEDWVYQRSSQAQTRPGGGTLSQHCPNCGAPLDVDLAGVCSYCHAPVMSGAYDWVLSRIDQVS